INRQHSSCCLRTSASAESFGEQVALTSSLPKANECCCTLTSSSDWAITPEQTNFSFTSTTPTVLAVEPGPLLHTAQTYPSCLTTGPRLHLLHCVWRC